MDSQTAVPNQTAPDASTAGKLKPNSLGVLGILFFVLSAQAPLTGKTPQAHPCPAAPVQPKMGLVARRRKRRPARPI